MIYYNEHDPFRAEWLRNNIATGLLPEGYVDERDIRAVEPRELDAYSHVHLFAGFGGFAYAAKLAGIGPEYRLWTGGFPCQPFSYAGLREGQSDDRYLWPEVTRLLAGVSVRPTWCLYENVAGIADLVLDRILFDLESLAYAARPFAIPACAVDTPQERVRVFIPAFCMANTTLGGRTGKPVNLAEATYAEPRRRRSVNGYYDACRNTFRQFWSRREWLYCPDGKVRRVKPGLPLMADGISGQLDQISAFGDTIVPQTAATILRVMKAYTEQMT